MNLGKYEVLDAKGLLAPAGYIEGFMSKKKAITFAQKLANLSQETEYVEIVDDEGYWSDEDIVVKPKKK